VAGGVGAAYVGAGLLAEAGAAVSTLGAEGAARRLARRGAAQLGGRPTERPGRVERGEADLPPAGRAALRRRAAGLRAARAAGSPDRGRIEAEARRAARGVGGAARPERCADLGADAGDAGLRRGASGRA